MIFFPVVSIYIVIERVRDKRMRAIFALVGKEILFEEKPGDNIIYLTN